MAEPRRDLTLGVVGLGKMGGAIAKRLAGLGFHVSGYDIVDEARSFAAEGGVVPCDSLSQLAGTSQVVLLSLPSPGTVREAVMGAGGLLTEGDPHCVIDLSTTGYAVSVEIGEALSRAGVPFIDAPVSGGVAGAASGTLTIMASAPSDVLSESRPILESVGKRIFHVGESPGLGQVMKLVNNMISSVAMVATAEGVVVGTRAGLDPAMMLEVLNASSGRNSHTEEKFPKHVLTRKFDFGFPIGLLLKDVRLGLELAQGMGIPMVVTSNASQVWGMVMAETGDDQDMTTIVRQLERWADVEISSDSSSQKEE